MTNEVTVAVNEPKAVTIMTRRNTLREIANEISIKRTGKPRTGEISFRTLVDGQELPSGTSMNGFRVNFESVEWRDFTWNNTQIKGCGIFVNKNMNVTPLMRGVAGAVRTTNGQVPIDIRKIRQMNGQQLIFTLVPCPNYLDTADTEAYSHVAFLTTQGNFLTLLPRETELLYRLRHHNTHFHTIIHGSTIGPQCQLMHGQTENYDGVRLSASNKYDLSRKPVDESKYDLDRAFTKPHTRLIADFNVFLVDNIYPNRVKSINDVTLQANYWEEEAKRVSGQLASSKNPKLFWPDPNWLLFFKWDRVTNMFDDWK